VIAHIRRAFKTSWEAGHHFRAIALLVFSLCWLPLYCMEVFEKSDLGTVARFVSPLFGVTVQLLVTSWLMALAFKSLAKFNKPKGGKERSERPRA
jgi:hypothetical protein